MQNEISNEPIVSQLQKRIIMYDRLTDEWMNEWMNEWIALLKNQTEADNYENE